MKSNIILTITCTVFILSFAVMIVFYSRSLYYFDIEYLDIEAKSGLSEEEIRMNYDAIIDYYRMGTDKELRLPSLPMSQNAEIHFREVKEIVHAIVYVAIFSLIISIILIIYKVQKKDGRYLKYTAISTIAVPLILGIVMTVWWESFFVTVHKIIFRNDYWLFDPYTDPVILILPDEYFLHAALCIVSIIGLGSLVCWIFYRIVGMHK
jgi:integral membrane protein (TIGR01906 family)